MAKGKPESCCCKRKLAVVIYGYCGDDYGGHTKPEDCPRWIYSRKYISINGKRYIRYDDN